MKLSFNSATGSLTPIFFIDAFCYYVPPSYDWEKKESVPIWVGKKNKNKRIEQRTCYNDQVFL